MPTVNQFKIFCFPFSIYKLQFASCDGWDMEANQHAYTVSVARPGGKTTLGKPLRTWKDIGMQLKQTGWEGVDCIHLPQLLKFLRTQQWTFGEISWLSENLLDSQGLKPMDLLRNCVMSRPHCSCYKHHHTVRSYSSLKQECQQLHLITYNF